MRFLTPLKIGLLSVLVLVTGAIIWSFISRAGGDDPFSDVDLLSPEIARRSTQFVYEENRDGRVVFRVSAETSIEEITGLQTLSNVHLVHFDESGKPSDAVSSRKARYQIDQKQISFTEDVLLQLAEGIRVLSEQVDADLQQKSMMIPGSFEFKRGEMLGRGNSLLYTLSNRRLEIREGIQLGSSANPGFRVESQEALYHLRQSLVELKGSALITDADRSLKADQMQLFLTPEQSVERILSSGNAKVISMDSQEFSGDRIHIFLDPLESRLRHFEVMAPPQHSRGFRRATYRSGQGSPHYAVEADRITGIPGETGLKTFTAEQQVHLRSDSLGIEQAYTDHLVGSFSASDGELERLELKGQVQVTKRSSKQAGGRELLRSNLLTLEFLPGTVMHSAIAQGNVDLELKSPAEYQHLFAKQSVAASYDGGELRRLVGSGDSLLEKTKGADKQIVHAATIEALYSADGNLESISGRGGVAMTWQQPALTRQTTSQRLDVFYEKGEMKRAVQTEDFHYWSPGSANSLDVWADRAEYEAAPDIVTVSGSEFPVLRTRDDQGHTSETTARQFVLEQKSGRIIGIGDIRTLIRDETGQTVITGNRMETEAGGAWVRYSEKPRIIQGSNTISGDQISFDSRNGHLLVEGSVQSVLVTESAEPGQKPTSYIISSNHLTYDQSSARFRGDVKLRSDTLRVQAPVLDCFFSQGDDPKPERIEASGGVTILDQDRKAEGNRAVYHLPERKVILTGDQAQVTDERGVKASGRQLTFHMGEEKLLIESPAAQQSP